MGRQIATNGLTPEQAGLLFDFAQSKDLYFKNFKSQILTREEFVDYAPLYPCTIFLKAYDKAYGDMYMGEVGGRIWYDTTESGTTQKAAPEFIEAMQSFIKAYKSITKPK